MRILAVAATLAVLLLPAAGSAQGVPVPAVVSAQAEMTSIARSIEFTGRVVALQRVELRARVSGFLEKTEFEEGTSVSEGDVLFRIERGPYQARVAEIEGQIAAAEAELNLATIEKDRQQTLVERETVAQSQLDIALANLGRTIGQVQQLKGTLQLAQLELGYTEIMAPFDGVVGLTQWDVGAFVGPESGALVSLVRQDPMTVEFAIPSAWVFRLRGAQDERAREVNTRVRLPDGKMYDHDGEIDFVDVEVNQGTDTIILRAIFPNPEALLVHGALVNVLLSDDAPEEQLSIPQQAVQQDLQGAFVLIVDAESKAQQRRIVVDRYAEGRAMIESGLEEGETVIVEGVNKARPGQPVDAAPVATSGQDG